MGYCPEFDQRYIPFQEFPEGFVLQTTIQQNFSRTSSHGERAKKQAVNHHPEPKRKEIRDESSISHCNY